MRAVQGRPGQGRSVLPPAVLDRTDGKPGSVRQSIPTTKTLRVKCWCDRRYVSVATVDVRRGITGSCGAGCGPSAAAGT